MGRICRSFYKPHEGEKGVYLHVFNHCVENSKDEFPLTDTDKEMFLRQIKKLLNLYIVLDNKLQVNIKNIELKK